MEATGEVYAVFALPWKQVVDALTTAFSNYGCIVLATDQSPIAPAVKSFAEMPIEDGFLYKDKCCSFLFQTSGGFFSPRLSLQAFVFHNQQKAATLVTISADVNVRYVWEGWLVYPAYEKASRRILADVKRRLSC